MKNARIVFVLSALMSSCGVEGPPGQMGQMGAIGATGAMGTGSPDTAAQVLTKFNSAVQAGGQVVLGSVSYSDPKYDLRWAISNSTALALCLPKGNYVTSHPAGISCAAACAANTGGMYKNCGAAIDVRPAFMNKPQTRTEGLGYAAGYDCNTVFTAGDPVDPATTPGLAQYCCCY